MKNTSEKKLYYIGATHVKQELRIECLKTSRRKFSPLSKLQLILLISFLNENWNLPSGAWTNVR